MKRSLKKAAVPVLAMITACAMCMTAYAAEDKITKVKVQVNSEVPDAGDSVGTPSVKVTLSQNLKEGTDFRIDSVEYHNTNDDEWERGETPVIRIELELIGDAADKYRFSYTSSKYFSVSGNRSEFKSASRLDSGRGLRVEVKQRKVSGELEVPDELEWDGRNATWETIDDADKYEVKLYRNGSSVTTVTTSNERYNFYPYMTKAGDYSFKVRAISNSDGEKSEWSDESDDYYMNSSNVYTGTPPASGSGSSGTPSISGGWVQDQIGWMYRQNNGVPLTNQWLFVDNNWFYLAGNGYMMTGWIFVDNNWFYLNPVSDGTRGAMKTGWQQIDGLWYYLNPVSDGTRGARKTSYQMIDGKWYFFDTATGAMWFNRQAPNGKWIDANCVLW